MPPWIRGDVLDVRRTLSNWKADNYQEITAVEPLEISHRQPLNIPLQLQALGLPGFQGRPHSGIDDARNIARILAELARRGVRLAPNTSIKSNRRWHWMGRPGEVREELL